MVYKQEKKQRSGERGKEESISISISVSMSSTAPVKSQPLHNFSLPYLKWGKNQSSNQRCRKQQQQQQQPTCVDHLHQPKNKNNNHSGCCSASEAESDSGSSHHQDQPGGSASATNLVIRIPKVAKTEDGDDAVGKPWNLRPRRGILKNENGGGGGGGGGCEVEGDMNQNHHQHQHLQQQSQYQPKSLRLRGLVEGENVEKKEKHKFSIPLTKEEIEEDFFAWTGSKPSRRPKKRNKTVQKHVDNAFPGLWLAGITADTYEVAELPAKKKKK